MYGRKSKIINILGTIAFTVGLLLLTCAPGFFIYYMGWVDGQWGKAIPCALGVMLAGFLMIEESEKL